MVKNHVAVTEKVLMVLSATGVGTSMCVLFTSVATAIATASVITIVYKHIASMALQHFLHVAFNFCQKPV